MYCVQLMELNYQRTLITGCGLSDRETKEIVMKTNKIDGYLIHTVWHNERLRQDTRMGIHKSLLVKP